ncbi:MAG TPA: hypothetical protein VN325_44055 [Steroidobacteraceae bacterium]|nr:hypothetical protein [Steroidobacteraceae bacterium]
MTIAGMSLWSAHRAASWIELKTKQGVARSVEVVMADIVLPDISTLTGKVKFLPLPDQGNDGVNLGYIVHADVPALDLSKVPKEYLQDKPLDPPLEKISRMAVTQVAYDSALIFELRDADNFELKKIESGTVVLWSGKSNRLQNTIPEPISREIASRTRSVTLRVALTKCLTCEGK